MASPPAKGPSSSVSAIAAEVFMSNVGWGKVANGRQGIPEQAATASGSRDADFMWKRQTARWRKCSPWFSQAMGPTLAALYCAVGPEWIINVIQSGSSRWKPQHYQLMKKPKPKHPYLLKAHPRCIARILVPLRSSPALRLGIWQI